MVEWMNARLLSFCICGPGTVMSPFSLPFFWPCHSVCGILVPQSGIKLVFPMLEAWSLNHQTTREVPRDFYESSSWDLPQSRLNAWLDVQNAFCSQQFFQHLLCVLVTGSWDSGMDGCGRYGRCPNRTQGLVVPVVGNGLSVMELMTKSHREALLIGTRENIQNLYDVSEFMIHLKCMEKIIVLELDSCVYKTKTSLLWQI